MAISINGTLGITFPDGTTQVSAANTPVGGGAIVGTTATQTLTNKTIDGGTLTGTLTAGGSVGMDNQILTSSATGVAWEYLNILANNGITSSSAGGVITLSPTLGYNGYGVRTVSAATPSGGNAGDVWYQI